MKMLLNSPIYELASSSLDKAASTKQGILAKNRRNRTASQLIRSFARIDFKSVKDSPSIEVSESVENESIYTRGSTDDDTKN